jgi:hypothetical protein
MHKLLGANFKFRFLNPHGTRSTIMSNAPGRTRLALIYSRKACLRPAEAVTRSVPERKMITGRGLACVMRFIATESFNWQVISGSRYEELSGQTIAPTKIYWVNAQLFLRLR